MKYLFSLLLILPLLAQGQDNSNILVKDLKTNFALPDFPAFKALSIEPSNILRPSTAEDFGFVADEFYNGQNLIIPKSFAAEFNPLLLLKRKTLTLAQYRKLWILKTSRISIGTNRDSLNTRKLALGYRISLRNKGDLKRDEGSKIEVFLNSLSNKADEMARSKFAYAESKGYIIPNMTDEQMNDLQANGSTFDYQAYIDELKKKYANDNWNAEKFDLAFAVVGNSPDSLLSNVQYDSFNAWLTYALPCGKSGQWLLGANYKNFNALDNKNFNAFSLASRFYGGSNALKGFLEGQFEWKEQEKQRNLLFNLGGELTLMAGLWVDFHAGYLRDIERNTSGFTSGFKFRYTVAKSN